MLQQPVFREVGKRCSVLKRYPACKPQRSIIVGDRIVVCLGNQGFTSYAKDVLLGNEWLIAALANVGVKEMCYPFFKVGDR